MTCQHNLPAGTCRCTARRYPGEGEGRAWCARRSGECDLINSCNQEGLYLTLSVSFHCPSRRMGERGGTTLDGGGGGVAESWFRLGPEKAGPEHVRMGARAGVGAGEAH